MTNIREFLASHLHRFIIGFLSRELHSLTGGEMGPKAKRNNQSAASGRVPQRSTAGSGENPRPNKFSVAGMATQFKLHENVLGEGAGAMQTAQGKY
jgi:hypothetical protein